jgi:hypothetical protein
LVVVNLVRVDLAGNKVAPELVALLEDSGDEGCVLVFTTDDFEDTVSAGDLVVL